jgi:hypothetical protein
MRYLVLGLLACWICVVPEAYALTGNQGPTTKGGSAAIAKSAKTIPASSRRQNLSPPTSRANQAQLSLDPPSKVGAPQSSTVESITSLANGSGPINPWVPERGAIGVRVKVTW